MHKKAGLMIRQLKIFLVLATVAFSLYSTSAYAQGRETIPPGSDHGGQRLNSHQKLLIELRANEIDYYAKLLPRLEKCPKNNLLKFSKKEIKNASFEVFYSKLISIKLKDSTDKKCEQPGDSNVHPINPTVSCIFEDQEIKRLTRVILSSPVLNEVYPKIDQKSLETFFSQTLDQKGR